LNSFNFLDDLEIEFLLKFDPSGLSGHIKVIKTRELYIIEANVPFEVNEENTCDTEMEFPLEMLVDCNYQKI